MFTTGILRKKPMITGRNPLNGHTAIMSAGEGLAKGDNEMPRNWAKHPSVPARRKESTSGVTLSKDSSALHNAHLNR